MKIRITLGLCAVLGVGFLPVRAADNPAQAAARAVLEHKLNQPDAMDPQPLMVLTNLPSVAMTESSGKAAGVARTASAKAATATAATPVTPVVAPVPSAPAVTVSPMLPPVVSLLMVSLLFLSLLVVSVLLLKLRQLKLKLRQMDSRI